MIHVLNWTLCHFFLKFTFEVSIGRVSYLRLFVKGKGSDGL